jgi:predicted O-methyltransferase YrrM
VPRPKPEMKPLWISILKYLDEHLDNDPIYRWIMNETNRRGIPEMQITREQGRTLNLLAHLVGARRILEIGTLSGYSTVWMARALPDDGKLITCEMNPKHAELAQDAFVQAGVADKIELHLGPALETLATLALDAPLDMTFIDADKNRNLEYFEYAEAHTRSGGVIVVDNIFLNGQVIAPDASDYMKGVEAFNRHVFAKYGDSVCAIPFYKMEEDNVDGILIVRMP